MTPAKRSDPPQIRGDAVWDGTRWRRQWKSISGHSLAQQIACVAARIKDGEKARAELLPLLDRARQPGPEHLTNGQLEDLTGYGRGYIPNLVKTYRASKENGETE